jgi:hypothetical protein
MTDTSRCRWCGASPADCDIRPICEEACDGHHSCSAEFVGGPLDGLHYATPVPGRKGAFSWLLATTRGPAGWIDGPSDEDVGFYVYHLEVGRDGLVLVLARNP